MNPHQSKRERDILFINGVNATLLLVEIRYNDDDGGGGGGFRSFLEPRWDYLSGDEEGQSPGRRPKVHPEVERSIASPTRPPPAAKKLWISMSLCYSENTRLFMKSKYPYAEVTPLAVILWRRFAPDAGVLVRIVYTGKEGSCNTLEKYLLKY